MKDWRKSRHANLRVYTPTGVYHLFAKVNGKLIRKSLQTTDETDAVRQRDTELAKAKSATQSGVAVASGRINFGALADEYIDLLKNGGGVNFKNPRRTLSFRGRQYQAESLKALKVSWPELWETDAAKVKTPAIVTWAERLRSRFSATRFNGIISAFKHILNIAILRGIRTDNPLAGKNPIGRPWVERAAIKKSKIEIPSDAELKSLIDALRNSGSGYSKHTSDFTLFLAHTALRIHETWYIQKRHVEWLDKPLNGLHGWLHIKKTKNGAERTIPIFVEIAAIVKNWFVTPNVVTRRLEVLRDGKVVLEPVKADFLTPIRSEYAAVANASEKLGLPHLSHHDFRHYCVSKWLTKGFSVGTIAKWLGHQDGGALLLRTYAHIIRSLELADIARVNGSTNVVPLPVPPADIPVRKVA